MFEHGVTETECSHCGAKYFDDIFGDAETKVLAHLRDVHGIVGTPRIMKDPPRRRSKGKRR